MHNHSQHTPAASTHVEDENAKFAYKVVGEEPNGERTILLRTNSAEEAKNTQGHILSHHSTTIGMITRTYNHVWWQLNR